MKNLLFGSLYVKIWSAPAPWGGSTKLSSCIMLYYISTVGLRKVLVQKKRSKELGEISHLDPH